MRLDDLLAVGCSIARRSFYQYCRIVAPKFYTKERTYLKTLCDTLQALAEGTLAGKDGQIVKRMILNMPPRHGKTRTAILFCQWLLGRFPDKGIITASYNELLSSRMARAVRDGIAEKKVDPSRLVYSDFFPGSQIKAGDASMQLWALEGRHFSFLATSPGGTMTGIGAQFLVLDDIIKNAEEAFNERVLEEHYDWYTNTVLSRLEANAIQLIIQTRWCTGDLSGKLLATEGDKWHVVVFPARLESGEMLAPDILTLEDFLDRERKTDPVIFQSNYQQKPFDLVDRLYPSLKEYDPAELPNDGINEAYVDTADTGDDYLAGATYRVKDGIAYITDILYTKEAMEVTEPKAAAMLDAEDTMRAWIESNNGGRGFARNVEAKLRAMGNTKASVNWFYQSANKEARILAESASVQNCIRFPKGWEYRWPEFYRDVTRATRTGKRKHDDALDLLTGIIEKSVLKKRFVFSV